MRWPAASPGRPLEAPGNRRRREMVATARVGERYRTRLTGLFPQRMMQGPQPRALCVSIGHETQDGKDVMLADS